MACNCLGKTCQGIDCICDCLCKCPPIAVSEEIQSSNQNKLWKTNDDFKDNTLVHHPNYCPHCGKDTNVKIINLQE